MRAEMNIPLIPRLNVNKDKNKEIKKDKDTRA